MAFKNPNGRSLLNKDEEDEKQKRNYFVLPTFEELQAIEQEAKEDAAKAVSSDGGLDFFQKPSNWDDGYQFGDITKTALGTLGDVGVGAVKGVMKMGEGIGDALQYGAAAVTDLFGADETAERIRKNAQREAVADAFRGVDEKLDRYSVLGRTSDAAAESLGQIGGILATGGLAGAAGLGAAGTTAVTTGVMGASSFGSGTSEAYAAGADEGEAEAYGAISGAADALSEMIFGGLGKGINALGVSKGLSSADDMLAKALSSKIKNTLAKNTVQLGVKAGAEGLEEVLAGTMQAAGKKMTYMSERDFLDILEDENLLEQFVVGALASGIAQAPGYVSASRAGVDLVSDGGAEGAGGAEDTRASTNPRIEEIERTGRAVGADEGTMALARDVSSLTGRGVRFFSEAENDGYINNGFYDPDSNTININVKSKNPSAQILSHELTHSIENTDSYLQLRSVIFDRMKRDGMDIDAEYRKKEMLYNDAGYRLRDEGEIAHEIIAEQIEKRYLTDEASIRSLVSENRTLGQRIREWFDSLLAKMGNAEAKERDYVRQVRDLYAKALGESVRRPGNIAHSLQRVGDTYYVNADKVIFTREDGTPASQRDVFDALVGETIETPDGSFEIVNRLPGKSMYDELYKRRPSRYTGVDDIKTLNSDVNYNMEELLENTTMKKPNVPDKDGRHSEIGIKDFDTRTVKFYDGTRAYDIEFSIATLQDGRKIGYAKKYFGYDAELTKKIQEAEAMGGNSQLNQQPVSNNSISQDDENVNREFSVSKVVEETKDLIAVHNLNADKLMKSLALGGMPMPSIAIAKAEVGHENFGDISLVFDKSTIDPQESAANKVYSGDAWTPTYPSIEYKVNEAVRKRVEKKIRDLVPYDVMSDLGRVSLDSSNIEDTVRRNNGDMVEAYRNESAMKYAYLRDSGTDITLPTKEKSISRYNERENGAIIHVAEVIGAEELDRIRKAGYEEMQAAEPKIRAAVAEYMQQQYADDPELRDIMTPTEPMPYAEYSGYVYDAMNYLTNGIRQEVDYKAAREIIDGQTDQEAYEAWLGEQFDGIVEKEGIRNNVDYFTPSGNRRSFEATHWENTLENVVRAMKESGEKGVGHFGTGNIFGAATQEMKSIDAVKKAEGRLQNLSEEEYQEIKEGYQDRFFALAAGLPKNKGSFTAADDAANMLVEAVVKYKTKKGIDGYLRRESQGWANYSPDVTEELISLVNDIRAMPTQYFEAKPQRAVSFDEVAAFVIPRNADIKVKQELLNRGYSIAEYDPDVEGDRAKVLNGMDKYKFSISKSDDQDNKRVMPKRSAAGTKARARQDQQTRMRFEQKVMNRGFANLSPAEQEHYRDEIVGQYRRKYDDYKKKRDALTASGYQFAGVDDYVEKVVGSVEDAAIDANTFLIHYQEGVFGDPTREDVKSFAAKYLEMLGMQRPEMGTVMQNADDGYEISKPQVFEKTDDEDSAWIRMRDEYRRRSKADETKRVSKGTYHPKMDENGEPIANPRYESMLKQEKRKRKRDDRKKIARAETAFRRLGYNIEGAIVENYEDAAGIIEDNNFAAQVDFDIKRYIEQNNITPQIDTIAKLIASGEVKPTKKETGIGGLQLKLAKELASLYQEYNTYKDNNIRAQGVKTTDAVNNRLDTIFSGYDWFSDKGKKAKRLGSQLQLNLSSPEQVIRDVFGEGAVSKELNEYLIRPTIENSARARRQTNQMIAGLRKFGLNESESAVTQIFSEYSNLEESGSKKPALTSEKLHSVLRGEIETAKAASDIADTEYDGDTPERKEFQDSLKDALDTAIKVNRAKANQRALREFKEGGGTNAGWSALSKAERQKKIDAAFAAVTDESIGRITEATKELRHLLDDMYDAINAISVIHGAQPIKFRRGYMPHSHKQTEELQKWFNDHMGGINVTPVGDLPTDIAGKTADRKPNKRWFSHAQERTGPRTTWDALGNVEDYLRVANDTIYHIDDIRKMRVLERYIRGIYSVARGATGEEQRSRVRNDVMQRLHGELDDDELVFLGLKKREQPKISDEDMDLSQMTPFVTWLTNYANDLAAKQIFNRDIEAVAGRKYNNLANTITSWSSRVMMQYNISSNLKQLSQLGTVSGDVGIRLSKDAAEMTLKSLRNLGNGSNDLEKKYRISERSTFLAEKQAVEEATFASDKDLTEKQKTDRQHAKDIWDNAWSFTDTAMSRYAVYSYFMEGMARGMDDTAALRYADTKARNILASRMKGASPLIFQSKNPILRMFTLFQREPLAAWQDVLKTMPREYAEMKNIKGEQEAKTWMAKRVTGRVLGASMVNTFYAAVLGLGTPAMFDLLGDPLRRILEKVMRELTPDEEDDITWEETGKRFLAGIKDEVVDDVPFANLLGLIANTYTGSEFETRLALNVPDIGKIFGLLGLGKDAVDLAAKIAQEDDPEKIEALQEQLASVPGQIPITLLHTLTEIVGTAAPAGNQLRKSAEGLIAVLRAGEYTDDGRLKYEVGGLDIIPALLYGKSGTRAAQEWVKDDFDTLSKAESEAYRDLIEIGVSPAKAARYVQIVSAAEKIDTTETQAQAEGRIIDGMDELDAEQKAELYYDMVATDTQREAVDLAVEAGATITDAVETARAIRDASKRLDKITALIASDMETDEREAMYLAMVATKAKDADGNVIGTEDDERLEAMYATGLDFDDFLDAKQMQSSLNADESLSGNGRATRFLAWVSKNGYTDAQADVIGEQFPFSSGFRVTPTTYQKMVDGGVEPDNAVAFSDALSGTERAIDKINAMWGTGIGGKQLDAAIKAVVSEKQYENYHIIIDANVPLDAYTWVLDNADIDGNGSISNEEREVTLSRLALDPSDLSALWLATGGSEKSNPYKGSAFGIKMPEINIPQIDMPELDFNIPHFDFEFKFGGNKT